MLADLKATEGLSFWLAGGLSLLYPHWWRAERKQALSRRLFIGAFIHLRRLHPFDLITSPRPHIQMPSRYLGFQHMNLAGAGSTHFSHSPEVTLRPPSIEAEVAVS